MVSVLRPRAVPRRKTADSGRPLASYSLVMLRRARSGDSGIESAHELKGTKIPIAPISRDSKAYRRCGMAITGLNAPPWGAPVPRAEGEREQKSRGMPCPPFDLSHAFRQHAERPGSPGTGLATRPPGGTRG